MKLYLKPCVNNCGRQVSQRSSGECRTCARKRWWASLTPERRSAFVKSRELKAKEGR